VTTQICDTLFYNGKCYSLVGRGWHGLINPQKMGLRPVSSCTACWRGYQAVYKLSGRRLMLENMRLTLGFEGDGEKPLQGPVINGVRPSGPEDEWDVFNCYYEGINHPVDFSGSLLAADDFTGASNRRPMFHEPWEYGKVIELEFTNGILKE